MTDNIQVADEFPLMYKRIETLDELELNDIVLRDDALYQVSKVYGDLGQVVFTRIGETK